jgi:hypothetical protein
MALMLVMPEKYMLVSMARESLSARRKYICSAADTCCIDTHFNSIFYQDKNPRNA